jgi:hypothetical protein
MLDTPITRINWQTNDPKWCSSTSCAERGNQAAAIFLFTTQSAAKETTINSS